MFSSLRENALSGVISLTGVHQQTFLSLLLERQLLDILSQKIGAFCDKKTPVF